MGFKSKIHSPRFKNKKFQSFYTVALGTLDIKTWQRGCNYILTTSDCNKPQGDIYESNSEKPNSSKNEKDQRKSPKRSRWWLLLSLTHDKLWRRNVGRKFWKCSSSRSWLRLSCDIEVLRRDFYLKNKARLLKEDGLFLFCLNSFYLRLTESMGFTWCSCMVIFKNLRK